MWDRLCRRRWTRCGRAAAYLLIAVGNPPTAASQAVSPVDVTADEIARETGSLSGWPPYAALARVPEPVREGWRLDLRSAEHGVRGERERILASVLLEILGTVDDFDRCGLWTGRDTEGACYDAWLRYYLGWQVSATELAALLEDQPWQAISDPAATRADPHSLWARFSSRELLSTLEEVVGAADRRAKSASERVLPWAPTYDEPTLRPTAGGPQAAYVGVDRRGVPIIQVDTVAARRWSPGQVERIVAHELWPGHHLLASVTGESLHPVLAGVRWIGFVEGWSTYAEELVTGSPNDDARTGATRHLQQLAALARVDVGIHAEGWEEAAAADTLRFRAGFPTRAAEDAARTLRSRPGHQAAYYIGYLAIREMRAAMQPEPSSPEELRKVHARLLRWGPLPLGVARDLVARSAERSR